MTAPGKRYVAVGETVAITLPHSEVCMHMGVAGRTMLVTLTDTCGAQLAKLDGSPFSFPILPGEAGLYHDAGGHYGYLQPPDDRCAVCHRDAHRPDSAYAAHGHAWQGPQS